MSAEPTSKGSRRRARCLYLDGGDPEDPLCGAALVVGSTIPLDPERAETIANLTGTTDELED